MFPLYQELDQKNHRPSKSERLSKGGNFNPKFCDNLEEQGWFEGVREVQEGADICILTTADSRCFMEETQNCKAIICQLGRGDSGDNNREIKIQS